MRLRPLQIIGAGLFLLAAQSTQAQVLTPDQAKAEVVLVNDAHMKFMRPQTRMLKVSTEATISQLGMPDKHIKNVMIGHQTATAYRADIHPGTLQIDAFNGKPAREILMPKQSMLYRADRKELRHQIDADHVNDIKASYFTLDSSALPEQFQNLLEIDEIPDVLVNAGWTGYRGAVKGQDTLVLKMERLTEVEPDIFSQYTLYVDPQSHIIRAVDSVIVRTMKIDNPPKDLAPGALVTTIRSHLDVEQIVRPNAKFEDSLFELEFPKGAEVKKLLSTDQLQAVGAMWIKRSQSYKK
ncbi:MAG: hypothetical protein JSS49_29245 [Planctomycetes bacterium]|nr:hypothetical protein [Planctomycetota bacterium]